MELTISFGPEAEFDLYRTILDGLLGYDVELTRYEGEPEDVHLDGVAYHEARGGLGFVYRGLDPDTNEMFRDHLFVPLADVENVRPY